MREDRRLLSHCSFSFPRGHTLAISSVTSPTLPNYVFFLPCVFFCFWYCLLNSHSFFFRGGGEGQKKRERENPKQVPQAAGGQCGWGFISQPWDHDWAKTESQTLNWLSHPGARLLTLKHVCQLFILYNLNIFPFSPSSQQIYTEVFRVFPLLYWDIIDIRHSVSLRCTMCWSDIL